MLKEIHLVIQRYRNKNIEKVVLDKLDTFEANMKEWKDRTQKVVMDSETKHKKVIL